MSLCVNGFCQLTLRRKERREMSEGLEKIGIFFDADKPPDQNNEYVAWLDVVGIEQTLKRSHKRASYFFGKIRMAP